jgi:hypothetical protein
MNIHKHMKVAEEMELHKGFVIQAQKRYLKDTLANIDNMIGEYLDWVDGVFDINELYALLRLDTLCREKQKAMKQLAAVTNILKPNSSAVTDAMIETAMQYPVENLIDFRRGKAVCFSHDDTNPSMFHATRTNQAACMICDKYYNPIKVLMIRDGMSFITAVKALQ